VTGIHTEYSETQRLNVLSAALGLYRSARRDQLTGPAAFGVAVALVQHGLGLRLSDACHIFSDFLIQNHES